MRTIVLSQAVSLDAKSKDGNKVLEVYKQSMPDMIFLDIHLPGQTGIHLAKQIRDFDRNAHIVLVSADSTRDNLIAARINGIKGFLLKPIDKERLLSYFNNCPTTRFEND